MVLWEEFLPVEWDESESTYKWSNGLRCCLQTLSDGPSVSAVSNGDTLADFLLQVAHPDRHPDAAGGVNYYFDEVVEAAEARVFFDKTLPKMADLALRLPELLVEQIETSKKMAEEVKSSGDDDSSGVLLPSPLQVSFRFTRVRNSKSAQIIDSVADFAMTLQNPEVAEDLAPV